MNKTKFHQELKLFIDDKKNRTTERSQALEEYYYFTYGGSDFVEYVNKKIRKKLKDGST